MEKLKELMSHQSFLKRHAMLLKRRKAEFALRLLSIVQLSMFFFVVAVSCDSFYIISKHFMFVNNFFKLFFVAFLNLSSSSSDILSYISLSVNNFFEVFFRSYFQTKRRKRDSNPRAGCPTYTLSRGASSAS